MPVESDNGGPRYQIDCSIAVARALRAIVRRAQRIGRGEEVEAAFRLILKRLSRSPFDFGEPVYHLPALRMEVRQAAFRPLFVDFAVCEDRPLVYIKGVKLL